MVRASVQRSTWWLLAALVAVGHSWAGDLSDRMVTIDVKDAPLSEVAAMINREADVDIILHKDVQDERITATLSYQPVMDALTAIVRAYDLKLEPLQGNDIFMITRADSKSDSDRRIVVGPTQAGVASPATGRSGAPRVTIPATATPGSDPRYSTSTGTGAAVRTPTGRPHVRQAGLPASRTESQQLVRVKIPVRFMKASQIASLLGWPSIDRALDGTEHRYYAPLDVARSRVDLGDTINRHNGFLNLASKQKYTIEPNRAYAGGVVRDQFGDNAGLGGGEVGGPGGGGRGGAGGGGAQGLFQIDGIEELVGYDLISALIVRGEPTAIEDLRELVELLDLPPQQIEVEARFVTLSVSDADALGISWTMTDGTTAVSASTPSGGGASLAVRTATGNFQALITSIVRNNSGKVVNAPKVATQNGQPAIVAFQQTIPVTISDTVITDASQTVSTTIETVDVTTQLLVVPRVTGQAPNESITTVISPQVADVIGFVDNPSGGTIPIVAQQQVQTLLRVRNGETIALGGLVRKNNSHSTTKIPLLGDLPFIGSLFRSNTRNVDESELLIFITPTIMRELFLGAAGPNPVG